MFGWFRRVKDADVTVVLTDPERTVKCSQRFVDDLCKRVMHPALAELDRRFGKQWPQATGGPQMRRRFMAVLGLLTSTMFFFVILAQGIPSFMLNPCQP